MPNYIRNCTGVEIFTDGAKYIPQEDFKEGLTWEEVRVLRHGDHVVRRCITSIRKESFDEKRTVNEESFTNSKSKIHPDTELEGSVSKSHSYQRIEIRIYTELPHKWMRRNNGFTRTIVIEPIDNESCCTSVATNDSKNSVPVAKYSNTGPSCHSCKITHSAAFLIHTAPCLLFLYTMGTHSMEQKLSEKVEREALDIAREATRRFSSQMMSPKS